MVKDCLGIGYCVFLYEGIHEYGDKGREDLCHVHNAYKTYMKMDVYNSV